MRAGRRMLFGDASRADSGNPARVARRLYTGSGLFLTASVAGLALLAQASGTTSQEHVVATGLSAVGITVMAVVWQLWLDRIFSYNRVRAFRISELEVQLGMYSNRYITALDS